ncbi:MAG: hypothetical protein RR523_14845 [Cetobacterium sp.]
MEKSYKEIEKTNDRGTIIKQKLCGEKLIYETLFYKDGRKVEKDYLNRKEKTYYANGNLKSELYFLPSVSLEKVESMLKNDFLIGEPFFGDFYYENGKLSKQIEPLENGDESYKYYYNTGILKREGIDRKINDTLEGKEYFKSGELKEEFCFYVKSWDIDKIEYYKSGKVKAKIIEKGKYLLKKEKYYRTGELEYIQTYDYIDEYDVFKHRKTALKHEVYYKKDGSIANEIHH